MRFAPLVPVYCTAKYCSQRFQEPIKQELTSLHSIVGSRYLIAFYLIRNKMKPYNGTSVKCRDLVRCMERKTGWEHPRRSICPRIRIFQELVRYFPNLWDIFLHEVLSCPNKIYTEFRQVSFILSNVNKFSLKVIRAVLSQSHRLDCISVTSQKE